MIMPFRLAFFNPVALRNHAKTVPLIFLTCMGVYILFWSGHHYSIDGIIMFEYAKALLFQHSYVMNPPVVWGGIYPVSKWAIGQTLMYIPILALLSATVMAGRPNIQQIPYRAGELFYFKLMDNPAYQVSSLVFPILTAATAILVYVLGLQVGLTRKWSAAAALVFGLASPVAVYARFDYAQPLASFLLLLTIVFAIQLARRRYLGSILSGISMGFAILTRPETLFYGGLALLIITLSARFTGEPTDRFVPVRRVLLLFLTIGGFVLINQAINALRFGSPLAIGYQVPSGNRFVFDFAHLAKAVAGNLFSPGRGLFLFFPLSLFSTWGLIQVWKQSRRIAFALGSIPLLALALYSAWYDWSAGISWGPRFLIPVLPYVTVLAFFGLYQAGRIPPKLWQGTGGLLIFAGWSINLQGQLFDFLGFYASRKLSPAEIILGDYQFGWHFSPILAGWKWGIEHFAIDSYLIRNMLDGNLLATVLIAAILGCLLVLALIWMIYFRQTGKPLTSRSDMEELD
jgi:hypothetical protein